MQIGVVIPTYNEAGNLPKLVSALFALPLDLSLLVVDDNSPDGTGTIAEELSESNLGRMEVIHRTEKLGLASAYIKGFRYFLNENVGAIAQIDADFSHDPSAMIAMAKQIESCDIVLGSRYVRRGSVDNRWPLRRRSLSAWGNLYARKILGLPFRDITTGYRLWRFEALQRIPLMRVQSSGYVFQVEMLYLAHRLKLNIREIPIHFTQRECGKTKMSFYIQLEAALRVWQLPLIHRNVHFSDTAISTKQVS
jgi:dolichol-phosphate mannosyltransferase